MLNLAFIITFILTLSVAAFGILLSESVRKLNPDNRIFSILMYQQILMYVFAFYAIWGQLLIKWIISDELNNPGLTGKIIFYLFICALPFLLFSWWFLVDIFLSNTKMNKKIFFQFVFFMSSLALSIGYFYLLPVEISLFDRIIQALSVMNMAMLAITGILFLFYTTGKVSKQKKISVAACFIFSGGLITAGAKYYTVNQWLAMLFILFVFASSALIPFLFKYIICAESSAGYQEISGFSSFCEKYGISKREAEIIEKVCAGLTNQEIADKLFITLQTVKDHVSRIYLKTSVRNRTELANLVRDNQ